MVWWCVVGGGRRAVVEEPSRGSGQPVQTGVELTLHPGRGRARHCDRLTAAAAPWERRDPAGTSFGRGLLLIVAAGGVEPDALLEQLRKPAVTAAGMRVP